MTVKNVFRSKATARSVFGRHRPATNSRYRSTSRSPRRYRTWPDPDMKRTRHGKLLISAPSRCVTRNTGVTRITRALSDMSGEGAACGLNFRLQRVINGCQPWATWAPERLLDPFHESDKSHRY